MRKAFLRVFNAGWTNFKRNSYLTLGTTGVMALVLLLFSGLLVLNYVSDQIVSNIEDKVDVSVYFKTDTSENEILQIKSDVESLPEVKNITYISREQALAEFKVLHAGQATIQESLAELDFNPLQASLNIKAYDSTQYASIVGFLEGNKFRVLIDKINFYENEAVINRIQNISNGLRNWGLLATLVLAAIAVLVTFNTIRLTIYNQKQEIEIMRLVGGSYWHIKTPYLVEGALYGTLAAAVTVVLFYPALYLISSKVSVLMPGLALFNYFTSNAISFVGLVILAGILLGVVSSFVAIRRFLKI